MGQCSRPRDGRSDTAPMPAQPASDSSSVVWPVCGHEHEGALHEMTQVSHGEQQACVDRGIASLILWPWKLGTITRFSCESGQRGPDVSFLTAADLELAYGALRELVRVNECMFHRASGTTVAFTDNVADH